MRSSLLALPIALAAAACSGGATVETTHDASSDARPDGSPRADAGADATRKDAGADVTDGARGADSTAESAAEGGSDGGVAVSLEGSDAFESEDEIAVGPDGTIGIAWTAFYAGPPYSSLGYRFSSDGGKTFSALGHLTLPAGLEAGDPAIAADAAGNFYVSCLGIHYSGGASPDYTKVFVAKAAKGTSTFGAPVEVSDSTQSLLRDHPKVFVTAKGTIAVAFMETTSFTSGSAQGVAATSTDALTWTRSSITSAPSVTFANLFWFCEGSGILYTAFYEDTATTFDIAFRSSTDEGSTWSAASTVVTLGTELPAGLDPSCAASGDDLWVEYATTPSPTSSANDLDAAYAIRVAHSGDRGVTVDAARMDALDTTASKLGLLPLLVRESGGALDVAYLAGDTTSDPAGTMRYARAAATSFAPSVVVDGPLLFTVNRTVETWVGDYLGAAVLGSRIYFAYPMNASGVSHIYFRSSAL